MKVKNERIFPKFVSQLTDWEILSAFTYCSRVYKREDIDSILEYEEMCHFFFDGNEHELNSTLETIKKQYLTEYSKRHCN